ncbi:MAG: nickel-dependent lactate racemase [Desulfarculales bacterium]|nr:nickel-dependent lactate racemase [Desulfarculales bacterium]
MRINLNYGQTGIRVELDDLWPVDIYRRPAMPVLSDDALAVEEALDRPFSGEGRSPWQGEKACILISDKIWPTPNGLLLNALLGRLEAVGVKDITVLLANGLNRPPGVQELEELAGGPAVLQRAKVLCHYARKLDTHVNLGVTGRGTPILVNRHFAQADIKIVTGMVSPHFMAGYSGGDKVISPGICHQETITHLRSARILEDPRAANLELANNPMHADQMEIASRLGVVWALNVALDERRRLSFVNFGILAPSHGQAVKFVEKYVTMPVKRLYDTVLTSAGGYPLDQTYYQAVKGMVGATGLMAPGGQLFLAAECKQGLGSPEFVQAQRRLLAQGPERFQHNLLNKPQAEIDEWATEMLLKAMRRGTMTLYAPLLNQEQSLLTGIKVISNLEPALRQWLDSREDKAIAVVPEGPYVIPQGFSPQICLPFQT